MGGRRTSHLPHLTTYPPSMKSAFYDTTSLKKTCKWVKLSQDEVKNHMAGYASKVKDGVIVGRKRKVRSDKVKSQKKWVVQDVDEEIGGEEMQNKDEDQDGPWQSRCITKVKYKSNAFVDDEAAEDESVESDEYENDV